MRLIENLEISNFKSLYNLALDCNEINVFIGRPNVGKSNILECIGLLSNPIYNIGAIRKETFDNIFFDNAVDNKIVIRTDKRLLEIGFDKNSESFMLEYYEKQYKNSVFNLDHTTKDSKSNTMSIVKSGYSSQIFFKLDVSVNKVEHTKIFPNTFSLNEYFNPYKRYVYNGLQLKSDNFYSFLRAPFGSNIYSLLLHFKEYRKFISDLFIEYGYKIKFKSNSNEMEIQKDIDDVIIEVPLTSVADTLKRFIFYYLAIESNQKSLIALEEPESNIFPPYITELAKLIGSNKGDNQFFIATHSPYFLNELVSSLDKTRLNVFMVDLKEYRTVIREIDLEKLRELLVDGVDIFLNPNINIYYA